MANQNGNRNRNRDSSNQDWNKDENRNYRDSNFEDEGRRYNAGYGQNRGDYGINYNSDRGSDNEWDSSRGMYGSSMNRGSSNYSDREMNDWNSRRDELNKRGNTHVGYGRGMNRGMENRGMEYDDRNRGERDWWDKTKDEVSSWFGDDDAERRRRMDEVRGHKGKGPKGYTRSDERIKEDVNDRLSDDPSVDASEIDVTVDNREVTLTGTVNSRWEKRHAEDVVESVSGVKDVENRLKVSSNTNTGTGITGTGSGSLGTFGTSGSDPVGIR